MKALLRALATLLQWLLALVLLFEEWGWYPLARLVGRLARWRFFAWLERRIAALPPRWALAVFLVPTLMLLPVKIAALWLLAHRRAALGLAVIVVAKLVGTGIVARLFLLTRESLMQLRWFAHWYRRWMRWKDRLIAQLRRSPAWRAARTWQLGLRRWVRRHGRRRR